MNRIFLIPLGVLALFTAGVLFSLLLRISPGEVVSALASEETRFALKLSFVTSFFSTALALILAVPSGYFLARTAFPGKAILDTFLDLPLVITPLVAGVGLLFLFGNEMLGSQLARWGIHVLFTPLGAVLAQTFVACPIVMRSSRAAFERVGYGYEWAAATLGLRPVQVFFQVSLPMAKKGILAGCLLGWTRAMGEFGATLMVAGAIRFKTETLPIAVYLSISSGEMGTAIACAWILMAAGFLLLLALRSIGNGPRPGMSLRG